MQECAPLEPFRLPAGFMLGTATASLQIEGGDTNNTWHRWCEQGHIKDGTHCRRACDHWNRVDQDVELIAALGGGAYRMSVEWSRIEPEEGRYDRKALAHYRYEIERLIGAGIRPLVTLHHFSNPLWFEDSGGWLDPRASHRFESYARMVVAELGDLVSDWITINEPSVYLILGFAFGIWPPGESSVAKVLRGARRMSEAHARAYLAIHELRTAAGNTDSRVGVAHHLRIYEPAGGPLDRLSAALVARVSQELFVEAMTTGRSLFPLGRMDLPAERGPGGLLADFLGINYYTRDLVRFSLRPSTLFASLSVPTDAPTNDLGWEIYPAGLGRLIRRYWDRYHLPIVITENGTCDAEDRFRPRYLAEHLAEVAAANEDEIAVQGYFHWSLMDNFEWAEGLGPRFGLYAVDFDSEQRTLRTSGRLFAAIASEGGLTHEMIDEFNLRVPYSV